jgi:hypothetical protein
LFSEYYKLCSVRASILFLPHTHTDNTKSFLIKIKKNKYTYHHIYCISWCNSSSVRRISYRTTLLCILKNGISSAQKTRLVGRKSDLYILCCFCVIRGKIIEEIKNIYLLCVRVCASKRFFSFFFVD